MILNVGENMGGIGRGIVMRCRGGSFRLFIKKCRYPVSFFILIAVYKISCFFIKGVKRC